MRKSQTAAFGVRRGVTPIMEIEARIPQSGWRWSNTDVTISYGAILKIIIALWAATIAAAMLWP
jgi:hypothetical protein